jgi:hypothetical protein
MLVTCHPTQSTMTHSTFALIPPYSFTTASNRWLWGSFAKIIVVLEVVYFTYFDVTLLLTVWVSVSSYRSFHCRSASNFGLSYSAFDLLCTILYSA